MDNYEIYHHGILGMRWGVRRTPAQLGHKPTGVRDKAKNKIRSINDETKDRIKKIKIQGRYESKIERAERKAAEKISKAESKYLLKSRNSESKSSPKSISEMSDSEIRDRINRIRLENELKSLSPQQVSKGKKFVDSLATNVIAPAAKDAGKRLLTDFLQKKGTELLGLKNEDVAAKLQKEVSYLQNLQKKDVLTKYFNEKQNGSNDSKVNKNDKKTDQNNDKASKTSKKTDPNINEATKQSKDDKRVNKSSNEETNYDYIKNTIKDYFKNEKDKNKTNKSDNVSSQTNTKKNERQETSNNAQSSRTENDYNYHVSGKGTSFNKKQPFTDDVIIDADFKNVSVNDARKSTAAKNGEKYVNELLSYYNPSLLTYKKD